MTTTSPSPPPTGRARLALVAIIVAWLAFPFMQWGEASQDAAPFLVAGQFAVEGDNADIYGTDVLVMMPRFRAESCVHLGPEIPCETAATPFISVPSALLPGMVLSGFSPAVGTAILRLIFAAALAGGVWALANRLRARDPDADTVMVIVAVLLTPYAYYVTAVGQNTPLLFLSACLGLGAATMRGELPRALLWTLTIANKGFPALVGFIVLGLRRWRFLALSVGSSIAALAIALVITDPGLIDDFLTSSTAFTTDALHNSPNGSLFGFLHQQIGDTSWLESLVTGCLIVLLLGLWSMKVRFAPADVQWAWGWVAAIAIAPTAWWHYTVLTVAAVAVALAALPASRRPAWALPVVAAGTALLSLPIDYGVTTQLLQIGLVYGTLIAVPLLLMPDDRRSAAARAETERSPTPSS